MNDPDLETAYALETPADNQRLYADWADTYDDGFAKNMDYRLPQIVATILIEMFDGQGVVLDLGAGTGLVAQYVSRNVQLTMDALDISPDMLAIAAEKGIYRDTFLGDLTGPLDIATGTYDAIVSSGTFTHGHVGPEALNEVIRLGRRGALFVLSINAEHFEARGFSEKFSLLEADIEDLEHRIVDIYGPKTEASHKHDKAHIAVFRKR
ncbi:class I SAM-dependent methyltransferase [Sulfitobacter sp. F26204]|uniref:class I SAM-dependent DNA methyltransferase n=1 Tax=Sulfitobacter sp. F26204 TaxID=2996014 RepID=UPI00225DF1DF|nr:class I SAM-dependent methyltransferase [Sulfitobacter sp. F26204]MCX7558362.1 class I SAM-dependent methyltransferase [Sulfitobacter sp. F26204]